MADYRLLFPTNYVGAADLGGKDVPLTIKRVVLEELTMTGGRKETKPVVYFERAQKRLVLNKTNAKAIANALGTPDTAKWIGQKVTLYATRCMFGAEEVDCIRVRAGKARGRERPPPATLPVDEDPYEIDHGQPLDAATVPEPDSMDPEPAHDSATGEVLS